MFKLSPNRITIFLCWFFVSLVLISSSYAKPPVPVIFIHGFGGDGTTWEELGKILKQNGWDPGTCDRGILRDIISPNIITPTCSRLLPGDFYLIEFSDNQNLPIADQGEELEVIVDNVLSVNKEAQQVILVGHSMGGLAARAYLQFRATTNTVLKLITVGTPHQGAELAVFMQESCLIPPINVLCQAVDFFRGLDPISVAVTELQPDSGALELLNDLTKFPLPTQTQYVSIIGTGAQGIGLGLEDGDGVVSARSQNLANVAGAPSLQHEAIVVPILENDACKNPLDLLSLDLPFDLVSIDLISGTPLQSHTCEPEDVGVWIKLLQQLRALDPITSGEGTPDLTAEIQKFKVKEQKSGGQKVVAKVSITNVGTETAVGPFSVSLFLSDDDILDDQDELLDTRVVINDLAPGETAETLKLKKKGLEAVEAGSAIIAVDDDNQIAESNEENNILVRQIEVAAGSDPSDNTIPPPTLPLFFSAIAFAVGNTPVSVAIGDLNGDGIQDLVTANANSHDISVLLGNGDGTFPAATAFAVGIFPFSVAIGDLNGDGIQDLVTAGGVFGRPDDVSVLLGNGDGTFQAATLFAAGDAPKSVAIGDLNGDGIQDLVTANRGILGRPDDVSVLLGDGDGTFQAATAFAAGDGPVSIAIGDLDGDGIQDLVTANVRSDDVSVLLGNGDGTFQAATAFAAGDGRASVAIGDLNGDGIQDLVTANADSDDVSVLLGNGDGTFQAATAFAAGDRLESVAIGDLNGDGKPDLTVANGDSDDISVLLGNGDGTFRTASAFVAGAGPNSVAIGDLNGDGKPDLAVANGDSGTVSILLHQ